MFIEAIILGVIIGVIRNGRLSNLTEIYIRGWYLIILGVVIQYVPILLNILGFEQLNFEYITFIGMLLMVVALIMNLDLKGIWMILLGGLLNLLGLVFNGFKMPIHLGSLQTLEMNYFIESIRSGNLINYQLFSEFINWKLALGKFIPIPKIYPFAKVLSIGDIVMMLGIILFISSEMKSNYFKRSSSMLQFSYKKKI